MTDSRHRARTVPALALVGFVAALVLVGTAGIVSHRYDSTMRDSFLASGEAQKALVQLQELEHELNDAMYCLRVAVGRARTRERLNHRFAWL